MIKKVLATAGVAAAVLGASAPMAAAVGDRGIDTQNGNFSRQIYGNTVTGGHQSPQVGLVQGTLNKPCVGLPIQADVQNIIALVNVGVQDILNDTQDQQCVENSTAVKGDSALSHILEDVISENASAAIRG
ncbi:RdlA protein [Streptomyces sp. WAC05374]|uniref:rodlin n=1 Tax=Streptomyces sp. WAC05374 TaxID=2487420 RepID=UPI000F870F3D|nr:rodlin [Streptomyces sp. WAC05374]RST12049.1 RdlA protein [Streptomyces sp. WAC05374]TDF40082.1 RdlA protein [Streptomyces sp. WAC05374]TDF47944.1 RdlA protein [Streptomyces sp. WAC05374]TDF59712.1 RdlA protein [Streptomyces sp. WAC05374]